MSVSDTAINSLEVSNSNSIGSSNTSEDVLSQILSPSVYSPTLNDHGFTVPRVRQRFYTCLENSRDLDVQQPTNTYSALTVYSDSASSSETSRMNQQQRGGLSVEYTTSEDMFNTSSTTELETSGSTQSPVTSQPIQNNDENLKNLIAAFNHILREPQTGATMREIMQPLHEQQTRELNSKLTEMNRKHEQLDQKVQDLNDKTREYDIKFNELSEEINQLKNQMEHIKDVNHGETDIQRLSEQITNVQAQVQNLKAVHIRDQQQPSTSNDGNVPTATANQPVPNLNRIIQDEIRELKEIEFRKTSLIIFNLPETNQENEQTRKETDGKLVQDICSKYLDTTINASRNIRLGKTEAVNNQPRPIRITLDDEQTRNRIVNTSYKALKDQSLPFNGLDVRKLSLKEDRTPKQRIRMRDLVKERKRLQELNPNDQWVIRDWQITRVTPFNTIT